jgi:hypothetical protein
VTFQEYLVSKKIDAKAFSAAEPALFATWESEFGQMHPNSFTVQKLNLINPIRRKYLLPVTEMPPPKTPAVEQQPQNQVSDGQVAATPVSPPKVPRPMMKPKPKMN